MSVGIAGVAISDDLARVFDYSAELCSGRNSSLSYSSVLLCLTVAPDELCLRFREFSKNANLAALGRFGIFDLPEVSNAANTVGQDKPGNRVLQSSNLWGANFSYVFQDAQSIAVDISPEDDLDVRHVMAAYIYDPDSERQRLLRSWKLGQEDWSLWFLREMEGLRPGEYAAWLNLDERRRRDVRRPRVRAAGAPLREPVRTQTLRTGPNFLSDRWSVVDRLGHARYAYALYRFLLHPSTELPISISIQAPWGGGKTSLMKLMRSYMDKQGEMADAGDDLRQDSTGAPSWLTLGDALNEIQNYLGAKPLSVVRPTGVRANESRITIWFNPWKYENTEQVWSGLAEAIISGISRRLSPFEKELFWLRLNLSRIDVDKLRRQIHSVILEKTAAAFWRWLGVTLSASLAAFALCFYNKNIPWVAFPSALLGLGLPFLTREMIARQEAKKAKSESASLSLKDLISAPDYSAKAGLVHQATKDLGEVLKIINNEPIVIFIDDLDRCSPTAIADVFDGLNRFMSSEFPNCAVVLGMDDEVVASALTSAYAGRGDSVSAEGSLLGWRFMDKFVQLPFILPEPEQDVVKKYKDGLLSIDTSKDLSAIYARGFSEIISEQDSNSLDDKVRRFATENKLSEREQEDFRRELEARRDVDTRFAQYESQSSIVHDDLIAKLPDFISNPRDLKRCINSAKFLFFFSAPQKNVDPLALLCEIVLGVRWPQVVRFLRSIRIDPLQNMPMVERISTLYSEAAKAREIDQWADNLTKWGIPRNTEWLKDAQLFAFLASLKKKKRAAFN